MSTQTHRCPDCDRLTDITFEASASNFVMLEGEFIGLSDLSCRLYCQCGWELDGVLRDAVIDLQSMKVTAGQFVAADD